MTSPATPADVPAWQRLCRVTGSAGLAAVLVLFGVLIGSREEPSFSAPASAFLTFYRAPNTVASDPRSFFLAIGLIAFAWFVVTLSTVLRRAEGETAWRSSVAMASGVLFVALVLPGGEVAAAFRANDLQPQIARYAFDESQVAFANARVALGSFALCCGWVIVSTGLLSRWTGWVAIAAGLGLAISRADRTSSIWLLPYLVFWLWVLVTAVLLLRRSFRSAELSDR